MVIFDLAPMNYACCSFGSIEPFWNLSEPKRGYTPYRHQTDIRGVPVGGVGLRGAVTAGEWLYGQVTQVVAKHARWNLPARTESTGRLYGFDCQLLATLCSKVGTLVPQRFAWLDC